MKALYRHKESGNIFAIETDGKGRVLSTSGPLLSKDLDPKMLDYDDYWNAEIQSQIKDFVRISKDDYLEMLYRNGFTIQTVQRTIFDELDRHKQIKPTAT